MQTFRVVKEQNGWAVRLGRGMSTTFRTQALAIREALQLCASLRGHGVAAEVVIEEEGGGPEPDESAARPISRPDARFTGR